MMTMTRMKMMKITVEGEELSLQKGESWSMMSSHRPITSVGLTTFWDMFFFHIKWIRLDAVLFTSKAFRGSVMQW